MVAAEPTPIDPMLLKRLDLEGTGLTDAGLGCLAELKRLEVLALQGTRVTMRGVEGLRSALPRCEIALDHASGPELENG